MAICEDTVGLDVALLDVFPEFCELLVGGSGSGRGEGRRCTDRTTPAWPLVSSWPLVSASPVPGQALICPGVVAFFGGGVVVRCCCQHCFCFYLFYEAPCVLNSSSISVGEHARQLLERQSCQ